MRSIVISLCLILLFIKSFSQDYSTEFGKITQKEVDLKNYPSDTSASAAVLYDIGKSYFLNTVSGFYVIFEHTAKIKVFTKAGIKYGTIEIPYFEESDKAEQVTDLEAYTYNYNDGILQKTELKKELVYDQKYNKHWRIKKFTFPELHEGSIIEYKYNIKSPYLFNLQDWRFQATIPVNYSKYKVEMVPYFSYTFILQGASKFNEYNKYEVSGTRSSTKWDPKAFSNDRKVVHEYIMKDIPAFTNDTYIASAEDYLIKLDFQLTKIYHSDGTTDDVITTWPDLCNRLLKLDVFGGFMNSCEKKAEEILPQININSTQTKDKVKAIVYYVKTNYKWNDQDDIYVSQKFKEFIDTKNGNSADINLFLTALLKEAGIDAVPVILSTRDHGKIKSDFPFVRFFNYVAVLVNIDGNIIITDGTEPLLPYFLIPPKCLNEKGLAVVKKSEQWVDLTSSISSTIVNNYNLQFNENLDSLKGIISISSTLYNALNFRKLMNKNSDNKKEFIENKSYTLLSEIKTFNFSEVERPYNIAFNAAIPIEKVNGKVYFNPLLNETYKKNPFKSKDRTFPIDMIYSTINSFIISIKIPDGYEVTYLPDKKSIDTHLYSMNYTADITNNSILVKADYCFKKAVYPPTEYHDLKDFFDILVAQMNEKIVLEKIENQ